ncbi:MAG: elongation factor P maturation arginine rhamnosyltransferase EarP [Comamonadaceae bacterium]|nr:MAG: elongation factor P maturation arginine rhamnosyltransferase EarP [Comamonadaceae bacterium]
MNWHIFCKVIDNHGDLGVCWRLACGLAALGEQVRLWVDDPSALEWMAPGGMEGVTVVHWAQAAIGQPPVGGGPVDVLIEAFGCEPAPEAVAMLATASAPARAGERSRRWINLEYLSAERGVERLHGLPSPVFAGAGRGLVKHFFYPGFAQRTGGLLREVGLMERIRRFDAAVWASAHGLHRPGLRTMSLFCYEPTTLPQWLSQQTAADEPTALRVTAGRAATAVRQWLGDEVAPTSGGSIVRGRLHIDFVPHLPQADFDRLLWSSDVNFVRGEDSLVRALWAGRPFVWQIYPQDDGAHRAKLEAFLDWLDAPPTMRRFHAAWNGLRDIALPVLDSSVLQEWGDAIRAARDRLLVQDDLVTQLLRFVAQKS